MNFNLASGDFSVTLKLGGLPGTKLEDGLRLADTSKQIAAAVGILNIGQIKEEAESITNKIQSALQECKVFVHISAKNPVGLTTEEKALIRQKHQAK